MATILKWGIGREKKLGCCAKSLIVVLRTGSCKEKTELNGVAVWSSGASEARILGYYVLVELIEVTMRGRAKECGGRVRE